MTFVVDASVVVKWLVNEPASERAVALCNQIVLAPDLVFSEVGNALWKRVRSNQMPSTEYIEAVETLRDAPLVVTPTRQLLASAAQLAADLDHPIYDCFYLALAMREGCLVVTVDDRFFRAVKRHSYLYSHMRAL